MKKKSSRNWAVVLFVSLAACLFVTVTGWLFAAPSPAQEITQAVAAGGKHDVKTADTDTFINAFSSVLVNTEKDQSLAYVAAAKSLRPDLSQQITATAAEVDSAPADADGGDRHRVSRHRRGCKVCDRDLDHSRQHTLILPCNEVEAYLRQHPEDTRGPCPER